MIKAEAKEQKEKMMVLKRTQRNPDPNLRESALIGRSEPIAQTLVKDVSSHTYQEQPGKIRE